MEKALIVFNPGVTSSIVCGVVLGLKTTFFAPLVWVTSLWRRELTMVVFAIYCVSLSHEFFVSSVYAIDYDALLLILSTILLIDSSLKTNLKTNDDEIDYVLTCLILLGLIAREFLIVTIAMAFAYNFWKDKPKLGVLVVSLTITVLTFALILLRNSLDVLGGSSSQVAFMGAFLSIVTVVLMKIRG